VAIVADELDLVYEDFGVDATLADGSVIRVMLSEADQESLSLINGVESQIRGKSADLKKLSDHDSLIISGIEYTVKYVRAIDDGTESIAYLAKE
jgi:hypothetical protein